MSENRVDMWFANLTQQSLHCTSFSFHLWKHGFRLLLRLYNKTDLPSFSSSSKNKGHSFYKTNIFPI